MKYLCLVKPKGEVPPGDKIVLLIAVYHTCGLGIKIDTKFEYEVTLVPASRVSMKAV